jgi:sulfur carrier protein ThiS
MKRAWNYWAAVSPKDKELNMRISLKLEAILARHAPPDPDSYEIEPGTTVKTLISRLGIREDEVMLAFVNGKLANQDTQVPDRAVVSLCPYICGG